MHIMTLLAGPAAVPETGSTLLLLGMSMFGLAVARFKIRK